MSRTILVTGGAGYIGSHAVLALLDRGFRPVVVDNLSTGFPEAVPAGVELRIGDVSDGMFLQDVLTTCRPEAVLHFAGSIIVEESVKKPLDYFENNTANTLAVIKAWIAYGGGPFIFSSTAAVYGMGGAQLVREQDPTQPISPYGSSKLMSEVMIAAAAEAEPSFRPVCLRYFNVAGADPQMRAGQRGAQSTHLIRVAIETALGQRAKLRVFGNDYDTRDGTCERDFIHVSDLASAHVAALDYLFEGGAPATFNCGYGRGYSVLDVIKALSELTGRELPFEFAPRRSGDPSRLIADTSALHSKLDWAPKHDTLADILSTAMAWQRGLDDHDLKTSSS